MTSTDLTFDPRSLEPQPTTRASIAEDLRALGVHAGETLLLHASLSSLGWVCGGPVAVVQALLDVLGPDGTIAVPTQTGANSDPADWRNPPVPPAWWPVIREHMPAYDPAVTPSEHMGVIAETVRTWPGAHRSDHPRTSFAAVGPRAAELMADHPLDCQFGDRSPLAALEAAGARVLLLGVGYGVATAFHLAEYRLPDPVLVRYGSAVRDGTRRVWATATDVDADERDFPELGAAFEAAGRVTTGTVGRARARLFGLGEGVAYATGWLIAHRPKHGS